MLQIGKLHPRVHRANVDFRAERNDGDRDQRQRHRQEGRHQVEELVDVRGDQAFLGNQLHHVGQRLQQSVRAHAVRSHAKLDMRDHLALDPLQIRERGKKHEGDHRHLDEGDYKEIEKVHG